MKRHSWEIILGISLVLLSVVVYGMHFLIFRDARHIMIYLVGDIAFVFIKVLLVSLIIHGILARRERLNRLQKLNIVIGAFFSEAGTRFLRMLAQLDPNMEAKQKLLHPENTPDLFPTVCTALINHEYTVDVERVDWVAIHQFLAQKQDFLLRLLENPYLLEHAAFTDILWAIFHLSEELEARENLNDLPETDRKHLGGDVNRVYGQLVVQWMLYMQHLRDNYPYLFHLPCGRTRLIGMHRQLSIKAEKTSFLPQFSSFSQENSRHS